MLPELHPGGVIHSVPIIGGGAGSPVSVGQHEPPHLFAHR